jgi:hypothetical protein
MTTLGSPGQRKRSYFAARWHGEVPLKPLFWWDMLTVGTLVNALAGLVSLMLLARGLHPGLWVAWHFLLVPYNLFLLLVVWRAARDRGGLRSLALCWFGCTFLF